jgi:hypothetical protein
MKTIKVCLSCKKLFASHQIIKCGDCRTILLEIEPYEVNIDDLKKTAEVKFKFIASEKYK